MNEEPELQGRIDQTQFSEEEPLFESPESHPKNIQPSVAVTPPANSKHKKMLIIGISIIAIILLIITILALAMGRPKGEVEESITPSPSPAAITESEMQSRITKLRSDLKEADPTKQDLTFPPVDLELRLDKKSN